MRSAALLVTLSALALGQSQGSAQGDDQTVTVPTVVSVIMPAYWKHSN